MEHGRVLAIFYYIFGALTMACSSIFILHVIMGMMLASGSWDNPGTGPPAAAGFFLSGIGLLAVAIGWCLGILMIVGGRFLATFRHHTFCIVAACLVCMNFPLGTILGVFTILWLVKPEVQAAFRGNENSAIP